MSNRLLSTHWLTVPQAAKILGCTHGRVRQLLLAGDIIGQKLTDNTHGHWLVNRRSVEKYADRGQRAG